MAKETLSNLPIPGSVTGLSTLKKELKTGEVELELEAALGEPFLKAETQFRLVIGSEIVLVTKVDGTKKILTITRKVEGSTEANHAAGVSVFNFLTLGALENYLALEWHELELKNSWTNYGAGLRTAAYALGIDGQVHLRGVIHEGGSGTKAFELPENCWPAEEEQSLILGGGSTIGAIVIQPSGGVYVYGTGGVAISSSFSAG